LKQRLLVWALGKLLSSVKSLFICTESNPLCIPPFELGSKACNLPLLVLVA
jgi:hypothetical protein